MPDLPDWVLDLVAAVERFEFEHAKVDSPADCLGAQLDAVPAEARSMAKGWAQARRALTVQEEPNAV